MVRCPYIKGKYGISLIFFLSADFVPEVPKVKRNS